MRTGYNGRRVLQEPKPGTQIGRVYAWFKAHPGELVTSIDLHNMLGVAPYALRALEHELASYGLRIVRVGHRPAASRGHKLGLWAYTPKFLGGKDEQNSV